MGCFSINKGINASCDTSMGGIKKVFLLNTEVEATVSSGSTGDDMVTALSGTTTANTFEFKFKKGAANMTSTLTVDAANGVNYVSTELQMTFSKMEAGKRTAIAALSIGQVKGVVVDANGNGWFLGYDEPLEASAGTGQTGAAKGDGNNYQITMTDESVTYPYPVAPSVIAELEGIVAQQNA